MCPRDPPCEEEEHVEEINAVLTEEVLLKIFSFLSPSDLKASMLVCKLWTQVGQAPSLWRWATLTADETFLPAKLNLTRLRYVSELQIKAGVVVTPELMQAITEHCGLRKVEFGSGEDLSNVSPELFSKTLINLEKVIISGTHLTTEQQNALFIRMRSEENRRIKNLLLSKVDLTSVEPSLLAQAVENVETVALIRWPSRHQLCGVAIVKTLNNFQTSLQEIEWNLLYNNECTCTRQEKESSMKADFIYISWVALSDARLTTQQLVSLFTYVKGKYSKIYGPGLTGYQLSSDLLYETMMRLEGVGVVDTQNQNFEDDMRIAQALFEALREPG